MINQFNRQAIARFMVMIFAVLGSCIAYQTPAFAMKGGSCSSAEKTLIQDMIWEINSRLDYLTQNLSRYNVFYAVPNFVRDQRQFRAGDPKNFEYEDVYLKRMLEVFTKMKKEVKNGIKVRCVDSMRDKQCRNGQVQAYVMAMLGYSYGAINLCSTFFTMNNDFDSKMATFFHELSHYSANTEDYALDWLTAKSIDLKRASNDAYHFEKFAHGEIEGTLKMFIWSVLWPAKALAPEEVQQQESLEQLKMQLQQDLQMRMGN